MTIIAKKLMGGGVINEELRVKNEKCKRHSSLFNLHSSLSFLFASVLALVASCVWAANTTYYQIAGTKDRASIISMDGLSSDTEITTEP